VDFSAFDPLPEAYRLGTNGASPDLGDSMRLYLKCAAGTTLSPLVPNIYTVPGQLSVRKASVYEYFVCPHSRQLSIDFDNLRHTCHWRLAGRH
jgi:hypothetical protein